VCAANYDGTLAEDDSSASSLKLGISARRKGNPDVTASKSDSASSSEYFDAEWEIVEGNEEGNISDVTSTMS
jgi:hypothetical protein